MASSAARIMLASRPGGGLGKIAAAAWLMAQACERRPRRLDPSGLVEGQAEANQVAAAFERASP